MCRPRGSSQSVKGNMEMVLTELACMGGATLTSHLADLTEALRVLYFMLVFIEAGLSLGRINHGWDTSHLGRY